MSDSRLALTGIGRRIGATLILRGINFELRPGEIHALVGPTGCGKSDLARLIAGVERPDGGYMILDGKSYAPRSPADARRAGVVMIHPRPALVPDLSVAANILLGSEDAPAGFLSPADQAARARGALERVERSDIPLSLPAGLLSPADARVVEIARVLVSDARVVVLDEPTGVLDPAEARRVHGHVRRWRDRGVSVVLISDCAEEVEALADRVTVLRAGQGQGSFVRSEWTREKWAEAVSDGPAVPQKRSSGVLVLPGPATPTPLPATAPSTVPPAHSHRPAWPLPQLATALLVFGVLMVALAVRGEMAAFWSADNVRSLVIDTALPGVIALGALLVLTAGGVDLSAGSLACLTVAVAGHATGPIGLTAALLVAAAGGAANGVAVAYGRIPPVTATLATAGVFLGLARLFAGGPHHDPALTAEGAVVVTLIAALVATSYHHLSIAGRYAAAFGSDATAARLTGIAVAPAVSATYTLAGTASGVAGLIWAANPTLLEPAALTGTGLAAALAGGRCGFAGTMIGIVIIGMVVNGCRALGVAPEGAWLVIGAVTLAAAAATGKRA